MNIAIPNVKNAKKVILTATAFAVLSLALGLANETSAQRRSASSSFSFGFNSSNGYSTGINSGGFYNDRYSNSNWRLDLSTRNSGYGSLGGYNRGTNFGIGGSRQQSWGNGFGPSGPYQYRNGRTDRSGYLNGWNNRWRW